MELAQRLAREGLTGEDNNFCTFHICFDQLNAKHLVLNGVNYTERELARQRANYRSAQQAIASNARPEQDKTNQRTLLGQFYINLIEINLMSQIVVN